MSRAEITLQKSANLPQSLPQVFKYVDKKDFDGLKSFFSVDFRLYFAHYTLQGITHPPSMGFQRSLWSFVLSLFLVPSLTCAQGG